MELLLVYDFLETIFVYVMPRRMSCFNSFSRIGISPVLDCMKVTLKYKSQCMLLNQLMSLSNIDHSLQQCYIVIICVKCIVSFPLSTNVVENEKHWKFQKSCSEFYRFPRLLKLAKWADLYHLSDVICTSVLQKIFCRYSSIHLFIYLFIYFKKSNRYVFPHEILPSCVPVTQISDLSLWQQ